MILSLFLLTIFPLYVLAGPSGCHYSKDAIGQACSFATDQDYVRASRYWCTLNANNQISPGKQMYYPGQGNTAWLQMTDSTGKNIAMWGNLNVDKKVKGSVTLDYDMCVDLMLMIKNGNKNAISGGCGTSGGWLPYGGNSGIYSSAATSNSVFQGICVQV